MSREDIQPDGDPLEITSIDDSGDGSVVRITTAAPHGLAPGDLIEVAGVDDDELSYDGTYTVGVMVSETEILTGEVDPFDGDDPDAAGATGCVQRLVRGTDPDRCAAFAQPEKGIPVGSGISQDYPVTCDPELFLCVLDADPTKAPVPVLAP